MKKQTFEQQLFTIRAGVQDVLKRFFASKSREAKKIDPLLEQTAGFVRDQTLNGGKRVRAALVVQGYLSSKKQFPEELYRIGAAMELVHSFLLIHDDIIDQDGLRRGKPAMHVRFASLYRNGLAKDDLPFVGNSLALLAGDIACVWGYELFSQSDFPPKEKIRALAEMNQMIFKCGAGEMLDVDLGYRKKVTERDIFQTHLYKTASYTVEGPLVIGAILGGAHSAMIQRLRQFARPLGVAFQIQDDILGLFGDEQATGKPTGSDLRQGKQTLLMLHAIKRATKKERSFLCSALGNGQITKREIERVRGIVQTSGSLTYSQERVQNLIRQAKQALQSSHIPASVQRFLFDLADYIASRST